MEVTASVMRMAHLVAGLRNTLAQVFGLRRSAAWRATVPTLGALFAALVAIGLIRNVMEVAFRVRLTPKWYSLDTDIQVSMALYPAHLCLFGAALVHGIARFFGAAVPAAPLLTWTFYVQALHLCVAPLDALGLALGVKWWFAPSTPYITPWFTNSAALTLGIAFVWLAVFQGLVRMAPLHFALTRAQICVVGALAFGVLYWPIYHLYPALNTAFNLLFGLRERHPVIGPFWGYAAYFAVTTLAGLAYLGGAGAFRPPARAEGSENPRPSERG